MAINSCSINGFTLHGFKCRSKFSSLVSILHPSTGGAQVGGWFQGQGHSPLPQRWEQPEVPKNLPTELDRITVVASFQGVSGTATQEITSRLDLVTVTDINVNPISISVNIENLKLDLVAATDIVTVTDLNVNPISISVNIENLKVNQDAKSINK